MKRSEVQESHFIIRAMCLLYEAQHCITNRTVVPILRWWSFPHSTTCLWINRASTSFQFELCSKIYITNYGTAEITQSIWDFKLTGSNYCSFTADITRGTYKILKRPQKTHISHVNMSIFDSCQVTKRLKSSTIFQKTFFPLKCVSLNCTPARAETHHQAGQLAKDENAPNGLFDSSTVFTMKKYAM